MFYIARYPNNTTFLHFKSCYQVNRLPSGVRSIWFYFSLFVEVPQRRTQIELLDTGRYCRHVDGSIQSKLKGQTICQCSSSVSNMSRNKQRNKNKTKQNKKKKITTNECKADKANFETFGSKSDLCGNERYCLAQVPVNFHYHYICLHKTVAMP